MQFHDSQENIIPYFCRKLERCHKICRMLQSWVNGKESK